MNDQFEFTKGVPKERLRQLGRFFGVLFSEPSEYWNTPYGQRRLKRLFMACSDPTMSAAEARAAAAEFAGGYRGSVSEVHRGEISVVYKCTPGEALVVQLPVTGAEGKLYTVRIEQVGAPCSREVCSAALHRAESINDCYWLAARGETSGMAIFRRVPPGEYCFRDYSEAKSRATAEGPAVRREDVVVGCFSADEAAPTDKRKYFTVGDLPLTAELWSEANGRAVITIFTEAKSLGEKRVRVRFAALASVDVPLEKEHDRWLGSKRLGRAFFELEGILPEIDLL